VENTTTMGCNARGERERWKVHEKTGEWAEMNNSLYEKGGPRRIRTAYFTDKSCTVNDVLMPKRQAHNLTTRLNSAHTLADRALEQVVITSNTSPARILLLRGPLLNL